MIGMQARIAVTVCGHFQLAAFFHRKDGADLGRDGFQQAVENDAYQFLVIER